MRLTKLVLMLMFDSDQTIGLVNYHYQYGAVINAKIRTGVRVWRFDLGAFGEIHLADYLKVNGGAFNFDSGRYRIVSGGPELTYLENGFSISLQGRFLIDATKDANFDYLGNLMGAGVSQGSIGVAARIFF